MRVFFNLQRTYGRTTIRCGRPQAAALIDVVVEGTDANRGTLDPIGAGFAPGADAYFQMMTANAAALVACLGGG